MVTPCWHFLILEADISAPIHTHSDTAMDYVYPNDVNKNEKKTHHFKKEKENEYFSTTKKVPPRFNSIKFNPLCPTYGSGGLDYIFNPLSVSCGVAYSPASTERITESIVYKHTRTREKNYAHKNSSSLMTSFVNGNQPWKQKLKSRATSAHKSLKLRITFK